VLRRRLQPAADLVFDIAAIGAFVALLATIWTLALPAVQALVTFLLVAFAAGAVANRLEPPPKPGPSASLDRRTVRRDTVSEEEYGPTQPADTGRIEPIEEDE